MIKPSTRCFFLGHVKKWERGFLGPTWTCTHCGAGGDLDSHSRMTFRDWVIVIVPTVIVGTAIAMLLLKL